MNSIDRRKVKCKSIKEQTGVKIRIADFCNFFDVPRSTFYYWKLNEPQRIDKLFEKLDVQKFKKWMAKEVTKKLLSN